ncbi:MAG: hypothetical protein ACRD82_24410, partial [Blastocatellia bacterium]
SQKHLLKASGGYLLAGFVSWHWAFEREANQRRFPNHDPRSQSADCDNFPSTKRRSLGETGRFASASWFFRSPRLFSRPGF